MTNPPPPGNWGPPQPPYGQGQPPYGPGQWPPQQQGWGQPPAPPKNNLKWLLIGVAVLLVIAISVGATLLFTRDSGGGTTQTATGNPPAAGEIASANDTGPVTIITEDPTCAAWRPIANTLANVQANGWNDRDESIPESDWSPELRQQYEAVASAMRQAADQTVPLTLKTPHRVMRELYEQSIAYWRAFADAIPDYEPRNNHLSNAAGNASSAIVSICAAIQTDAAAARQGSLPGAPGPEEVSEPAYPNPPQLLIATMPNSTFCTEWPKTVSDFDSSTNGWRNVDPEIPVNQWTPDQRAVMDQTGQAIKRFATRLVDLSMDSDNATLIDIAELAAQYWNAYVQAIPTYSISDHDLSLAAAYLSYFPSQACQAVES